jgi:hypothetical protein
MRLRHRLLVLLAVSSIAPATYWLRRQIHFAVTVPWVSCPSRPPGVHVP